MKPKSGTTVVAMDLPEKGGLSGLESWRPWEVLERLVGGLAVVAALAMLSGCATTHPLPPGKTAAITCHLGDPRVSMAGSTLLVSCPRAETTVRAVGGEGL